MKIKLMFAWYDMWIGFFWDRKKRDLYFFPIPMLGVRIRIYGKNCYVLRKRGYFYRPKSCGYTDNIDNAGRYSYEEAKRREYPHDEPVTMHHVSQYLD